jgi:hypothetical protein
MKFPAQIGLCAACRYAQAVKSSRGSVFVMCGRAKTDPRFSKYPRLPMLACVGFELREQEPDDESRPE